MLRSVLFAGVIALAGCERTEPDALPNVRLGMAPRDVRDRFEPGGEGSWQTMTSSAADDTILAWRARESLAPVRDARFEFHLGMLVAIRATTSSDAPASERVSTTPRTVTVRRGAEGGGTELVVLARDCPTHKEEAEKLAARAR